MADLELAAELLRVKENVGGVLLSTALVNRERNTSLRRLQMGKMLRPEMLLCAGLALGGNREKLVIGATAIELLHTASVFHDDVIDNAKMRRGEFSLPRVFGIKKSVLLGDVCFAEALRYGSMLGDEVVLEIAEAVVKMVRGEISQHCSKGRIDLSLEEALLQAREKTGALFSLAAKLGAAISKAPYTIRSLLGEFGELFGLVFQLQDDYLDYFGEPEILGKAVGRDMEEGVVTLPFLLASQLTPHPRFVREFAEGTFTIQNLPEVRQWIAESGALEKLSHIIVQQKALAGAALRCLPQDIFRDRLMFVLNNLGTTALRR